MNASFSPFGQRCSSIHDPRLTGYVSSWLPHTEVPISNLKTEVNIDSYCHSYFDNARQKKFFDVFVKNMLHGLTYAQQRRKVDGSEGGDNSDFRKVTNRKGKPSCNKNKKLKYHGTERTNVGNDVSLTTKTVAQARIELHDKINEDYMFQPSHLVNGMLCKVHGRYCMEVLDFHDDYSSSMVLQDGKLTSKGLAQKILSIKETTVDFLKWSQGGARVVSPSPTSDHTMPSTSSSSRSPSAVPGTSQVTVYDVSFGAMLDGKVPPRMLLFDHDGTSVTACSQQTAKRHKRHIRSKGVQQFSSSSSSAYSSGGCKVITPAGGEEFCSPCDGSNGDIPHIKKQIDDAQSNRNIAVATQTRDQDWLDFHLVLLKHYCSECTCSDDCSLSGDAGGKEGWCELKSMLVQKYVALMEMRRRWAWPKSNGSQTVTNDTPVPDVDKLFEFPVDADEDADGSSDGQVRRTAHLESIFKNFVYWNENNNIIEGGKAKEEEKLPEENKKTNKRTTKKRDAESGARPLLSKRLPVFRKLQLHQSISSTSVACGASSILPCPLVNYRNFCKSPWEGLFSASKCVEWKEAIEHYSKNSCNLFDDTGGKSGGGSSSSSSSSSSPPPQTSPFSPAGGCVGRMRHKQAMQRSALLPVSPPSYRCSPKDFVPANFMYENPAASGGRLSAEGDNQELCDILAQGI